MWSLLWMDPLQTSGSIDRGLIVLLVGVWTSGNLHNNMLGIIASRWKQDKHKEYKGETKSITTTSSSHNGTHWCHYWYQKWLGYITMGHISLWCVQCSSLKPPLVPEVTGLYYNGPHQPLMCTMELTEATTGTRRYWVILQWHATGTRSDWVISQWHTTGTRSDWIIL